MSAHTQNQIPSLIQTFHVLGEASIINDAVFTIYYHKKLVKINQCSIGYDKIFSADFIKFHQEQL